MPDPQVETSVFVPSPSLRPYVRQFVLIENLADRANTLLPEAAIIAGIRFKGHCSRDAQSGLCAVVTGLRDKPRMLTHSRGSGTIVAMFTPGGAAAILREPPGELFNTTMPIEFQVRRSQLYVVEEQLAEAPNSADRVSIFEQFLRGQIRERRPDRIVAAAVSCIRESRGRMRIEDLARRAGLSQSALERRFRHAAQSAYGDHSLRRQVVFKFDYGNAGDRFNLPHRRRSSLECLLLRAVPDTYCEVLRGEVCPAGSGDDDSAGRRIEAQSEPHAD